MEFTQDIRDAKIFGMPFAGAIWNLSQETLERNEITNILHPTEDRCLSLKELFEQSKIIATCDTGYRELRFFDWLLFYYTPIMSVCEECSSCKNGCGMKPYNM